MVYTNLKMPPLRVSRPMSFHTCLLGHPWRITRASTVITVRYLGSTVYFFLVSVVLESPLVYEEDVRK